MEFLFEKLEVYQRAMSLVEAVDALIETIKGRFPATRIDQLTRASLSIPLNIAEGNGRRRPAERSHFFTIARGSVFECVAVLEVLKRKHLLPVEKHAQIYGDLQVVAKMIGGLIRHAEASATSRPVQAT